MTEVTKDISKAAGKKMFFWSKVYNNICRSCKRKMFLVGTNIKQYGTQKVVDRMKNFSDNDLCHICKKRLDIMIKNEDE